MRFQPGTYSVNVTAINPLSKSSQISSVTMDNTISGIMINDGGIACKAFVPKAFTITFTSLSTKTCVFVDYGDGTQPELFGDVTQNPNCKGAQPLTNPLLVSHTYTSDKTFTMVVSGSDPLGTSSAKYQVTISNADCSAPNVAVSNAATFFAPTTAYRSDIIQFSSLITINCQSSLNNTKQWQIFTADPKTAADLTSVDVSKVPSARTAELTLPARFLPVGLYHVVVNVTITVRFPSGAAANFSSTADTYVVVSLLAGNKTATRLQPQP